MKVKDIMTREVETCLEITSLPKVATEMLDAGCGAVPVVTPAGAVVGIITDRDISMALVRTGRKPANVAAREAMTRTVYSCGPDDDIKKALATMQAHHVRRLPVLSETGRLLGILSLDDIIVRALAPDAPTSEAILQALRSILIYRNARPEPELVE
ncbi:MAG TPA: CBS domain-containing protein [Vicinamibacterales bacterium]|jgi:CBS domain-containing protein|nr:CBS domain-containing protein [Vicinamibacterales bacterium]